MTNGCITKKKVSTLTDINKIKAEENVVVANSDCYYEFYNSIDTFLNIRRPSISDYENRHLVPCCMELINSGDTLAKSILLQRMTTRIEMYKNGNESYISIYKIVQETLGNLPDEKALKLSLILFEIGKIRETEDGCGHLCYYIFKNVILSISAHDKTNYTKLNKTKGVKSVGEIITSYQYKDFLDIKGQ